MLAPAFKGTALTILAMVRVFQRQLKELAHRSGHEKLERASEHLNHCIAELEDCIQEIR